MDFPSQSIPLNWQQQSSIGRQGLEIPNSNLPTNKSYVNNFQNEYPDETPVDYQKEDPNTYFEQNYGNQDISKMSETFDMNQALFNDSLVDNLNNESSTSAKSYISMNEEFLANQEESWNKRNPLAMYDFMPEPKEEWAKQIIYNPVPFENVIQSGSTIINPNVYFSLRTPEEPELRQMLNSITLEKDALHLESSATQTQVKSQRKPSEPFSKPAVTRIEKAQAAATIQENGILPVNQIIRDFTKEHHIQLIDKQMGNAEPAEVNNQTVLPEVQVEVKETEPQEPVSALDLNDLAGNIPSLKPAKVTPPPVVTEVFSEDSSLMLNESLFYPPHLPPIPQPVSPSPSSPEQRPVETEKEPLVDQAQLNNSVHSPDEPILNMSVNSTRLSLPSAKNAPLENTHRPATTPLFSGSSTDLMGKLLFGSKEAAKDILESPPIETFFAPQSDPAVFSTVPQVQPSEFDHPSPLYTPMSSQINKSMGFSEVEKTPSVRVQPTEEPSVIAQSTVVGFGCVPLHTTAHSSICIRCSADTATTIRLSLQPFGSSPASVFAIQSTPTITLQPGETTTVVLSYSPFAVQEDIALLLLSTSSASPQVIPVIGFGGCCLATVTEKDNALIIGNSGNRTACFFTLGITKNHVDLVKTSDSLPPFFMLPPMMEFSVTSESIRQEIQDGRLPSRIQIIAVDNILRRRLLIGINRNAMIRCSDSLEILLLHAVKESSEAIATTHSLLRTLHKLPVDVNTIDITRDLEDGEKVSDLDTLMGREKMAHSHYMDVKMILAHMMGVSVDLNQIGGLGYPSLRKEPLHPTPLENTFSNPVDFIPLAENETSDPGFVLPRPSESVKAAHISVIPQLIYITPGELKRDQISIFNHSTEDVYFSIPDIPQQVTISPTQGVIKKLSSFLLTVELSQIGVYQLDRTLHLKVYVDKIDFDVEIRIQPFTDEGPAIEVQNDPSLFVAPAVFQTQPLPTAEPVFVPQQPMKSEKVQVDTVNTLQFEGAAAMNKDVTVKDNYVVVPAGMQTAQLFKTVFYNYSSHSVKVVLDALQSPFDCSYRNFIIKPKKKVRVPIMYKPNIVNGPATCCVGATVSYED